MFVRSLVQGLRERTDVGNLRTFCLFVGCPRTGSTLLCSLLTAHPDAVVANELDILRYVHLGFRPRQLYSLILERDRAFADKDRRWGGLSYSDSYEVPGAHQGHVRELRLIGDKRGADTSWWLTAHPELLDKLERAVGVPVRLLHTVRDPYDTIATMHRQSGRDLDNRIDTHFRLCQTVADLKKRSRQPILDVRSEDLIIDPVTTLKAVCDFLDLEADDQYLEQCAAVVRAQPNRTREKVPWTDDQLARVQRTIETFDFLSEYHSDWRPAGA